LRSWIFTSRKKGTFSQLMVYFSFVFTANLVGFFRLPRADFIICESPPLFLGITAIKMRFWKRAKLVMNISDLWPESAVQLGIIGPGIKLSILEWFEKRLYKKSILVSCQTEGIIKGVHKRWGKTRTFLLPNGVDLEMFTPQNRNPELAEELNLPGDTVIVGYGGNHGRSQALAQILTAANLLKRENIFFALFGDGPEKAELEARAAEMQLKNLRFYPSQPRKKMDQIQALWDLALVPLRDIPLFDGARPSKMFELMAGKIPFIFCGKGEGAELADESGAARVVPPEKPEELAQTIRELAASPVADRQALGKKGRKFVQENFDRAQIAEQFFQELASL